MQLLKIRLNCKGLKKDDKFLSLSHSLPSSLTRPLTLISLPTIFTVYLQFEVFLLLLQDRTTVCKNHLHETVEEMKKFNTRRKLKVALTILFPVLILGVISPLFSLFSQQGELHHNSSANPPLLDTCCIVYYLHKRNV